MKQYNLLLLGETGVGKSTFINAFANYLQYQTFEEALSNKLITLIPTTFTMTDDNYKTCLIKTPNQDDNEVAEVGRSATQNCKSYIFKFNDCLLRIIDTPGIGDTRGQEVDKRNLENVLSIIGQFDELHAICILMKPKESRITPSFEYCLKQLLYQLSKSASDNIMFIFTHARETFYKPGESLTSLESLLKNMAKKPTNVNLTLNRQTIYCVDNEAFRFLLSIKNGIRFNEHQTNEFDESWRRASIECIRLINRIAGTETEPGIKPHQVKDTISVNECRQLIGSLAKPLCDIIDNIQENLMLISEHYQDLIKNQRNVEYLKNRLNIPQYELMCKPLEQPATVCTNSDCVQIFSNRPYQMIIYPQLCHQPCKLNNIPHSVIGDLNLLECKAFQNSQSCYKCKHRYEDHMHVYYENEVVTKYVEDPAIKAIIKEKNLKKNRSNNLLEMSKQKCAEFEREQEIIVNAIALFSVFLKTKALTSYNDLFERYLSHLIENEKTLNINGLNNLRKIQRMEKILKTYKINCKVFEGRNINMVKSEQVFKIVKEITSLTLTGDKIKELSLKQQIKNKEIATQQDVVFEPKNKLSLKQIFELAIAAKNKLECDESDNESVKENEVLVVKPKTAVTSKSTPTRNNYKFEKLNDTTELINLNDNQLNANDKSSTTIINKSESKKQLKCPNCNHCWSEDNFADEKMEVDEINKQLKQLSLKDVEIPDTETKTFDEKIQNSIITYDATFAVSKENLKIISIKPTSKTSNFNDNLKNSTEFMAKGVKLNNFEVNMNIELDENRQIKCLNNVESYSASTSQGYQLDKRNQLTEISMLNESANNCIAFGQSSMKAFKSDQLYYDNFNNQDLKFLGNGRDNNLDENQVAALDQYFQSKHCPKKWKNNNSN